MKNPVVRNFFQTFDAWTPAFREEAISPVLNKCRPFLMDPRIRAVIGPAHSTLRFRSVIDSRKILLCDLSKGAIGSDNAHLLGSLIALQHKVAALSRYDVPEEDRVPHPLYVEEAHNFIGDFESFFSETRKYLVPLVIATQGIESLSPNDASAVFTNCGTLVSFRVSGADALRLAGEFAMAIPASDLQNLSGLHVLRENPEALRAPRTNIGIHYHASTHQRLRTVCSASESCRARARDSYEHRALDKVRAPNSKPSSRDF